MSVTKPITSLNELNPVVKKQAELFLQKCKEQGLNIKITETYRSQERQNYLYCQGRTVAQATAKGITNSFAQKYCKPSAKQVTWTLNSNHTGKKAFDICQNIIGKEYDESVLKKAGAIAKTVGLDWGGDWTSNTDMPHMENQTLRDIPQTSNNNANTSTNTNTNEPSAWAKESWEWCKQLGFVDGTNPKGEVTREQMASIIQRVVKYIQK